MARGSTAVIAPRRPPKIEKHRTVITRITKTRYDAAGQPLPPTTKERRFEVFLKQIEEKEAGTQTARTPTPPASSSPSEPPSPPQQEPAADANSSTSQQQPGTNTSPSTSQSQSGEPENAGTAEGQPWRNVSPITNQQQPPSNIDPQTSHAANVNTQGSQQQSATNVSTQSSQQQSAVSANAQASQRPPAVNFNPQTPQQDTNISTSPAQPSGSNGSQENPVLMSPSTGPNSPKSTRSRQSNRASSSSEGLDVMRQWSPRISEKIVQKGLPTRGWDCYRNALLQCMLHTPELYGYLTNHRHAQACKLNLEQCMICALSKFAKVFWQEDQEDPDLHDVNGPLETLEKALLQQDTTYIDFIQQLNHRRQCDPHELLGHIEEGLYNSEQISKFDIQPGCADITALLRMDLKITWTCNHCQKINSNIVSARNEYGVLGLPVALEGQSGKRFDLHDLIRARFADREHGSCDSESCTKARLKDGRIGELRNRKHFITHPPDVLIVRIDRSKLIGGKPAKDRRVLRFSRILNLGRYDERERPLQYQLQGVVAHKGDFITGGHYIALVCHQNGREYFVIDDDKSLHRVSGALYSSLKDEDADPYLLFYSRVLPTAA